MAITAGLGGVSGLWSTYILRKFVPMIQANYVFAEYAEPAMLPKNQGYVARWNVPVTFSSSTAGGTLTEASATDGEVTNTTINSVEATIGEAGRWMKVSDLAEETEIVGALDVYAEQFADDGSSEIDNRIRDQALSSTNFLHAGDTASGGVTLTSSDTATAQDFVSIAGFFHGQNAKGWDKLRGDYVWIIHPDQEVDMATHVATDALSWSDVNKHVPEGYEQLVNVHRFVGRLGGVTAVRTTNINTITENVEAYHSVALARWGVGWLGLGMKGPKKPDIKIKRPGPQDTSQPLDMYMTIGWKFKAVGALLDSSRSLVVYTAV